MVHGEDKGEGLLLVIRQCVYGWGVPCVTRTSGANGSGRGYTHHNDNTGGLVTITQPLAPLCPSRCDRSAPSDPKNWETDLKASVLSLAIQNGNSPQTFNGDGFLRIFIPHPSSFFRFAVSTSTYFLSYYFPIPLNFEQLKNNSRSTYYCKSKDAPLTPCRQQGGKGHSSYSFLTTALPYLNVILAILKVLLKAAQW
jgi:hypothetical protein